VLGKEGTAHKRAGIGLWRRRARLVAPAEHVVEDATAGYEAGVRQQRPPAGPEQTGAYDARAGEQAAAGDSHGATLGLSGLRYSPGDAQAAGYDPRWTIGRRAGDHTTTQSDAA
jgi:hypothetical protein